MKRICELATTLLFIAALFITETPKALAWDCDDGQNQPVVSGSGVTGNASLCVDEESLSTTLPTQNLVPGTAEHVGGDQSQ